ncbi:MAG: RdgB/HAM1 family non-canonical purine NTP pyrophosphatase [Rhodospirillales bacterium]|nr:RdgB/HAM1 family non-canonical purine NTP pyrophosphatase [Rhodospirillales bacterium]
MTRLFTESTLVIASHNPGKVREFGDLLARFDVRVVSASDLGLEQPIEDGKTFAANAELKARAAAKAANLPALADDSGLAVAALGGDPGIYSARWAGPEKDFGEAMRKLEAALRGQDDRRAKFVCALALCWPNGETGGHLEAFEGAVSGSLVWPPRGDNGFGYDPVFVADGYDLTFGEMDPDKKHQISHRADAFRKLVDACFR